jgi:hypothetical protein
MMRVNIKIKELPRRELFTKFRFHGSWDPANIIQTVKVEESLEVFEYNILFELPERDLYTTDAIYVSSEVLINRTPTSHGMAAFNVLKMLQNTKNADERYNYSLERQFSDYYTADEKRKLYGKILATLMNPEYINVIPSPFMTHEQVKKHAMRWCQQKAMYWASFRPAVPLLETIVLKHFISPNGYVFPPEMFATIISKPISYATLHSSILYSLYVWQLSVDNFMTTIQKLGRAKMGTWMEFITYNVIGFALELFALRIIYHSDEDIDLETGAITATERMEVYLATLFSDCEEKGRTILRVVYSFIAQLKLVDTISMDPIMLGMIQFLRYYVCLMTTNSTNDAALDNNNKLNKTIQGPESNGHVTSVLIPKLKFYRRHAKLPHVHNWSAVYDSLETDRPFIEILQLEGTGYQATLLDVFNKYITTGSEQCRENIQKAKSMLENTPIGKIMSSFIFNMDFALAPNETPNGFIRYITSGYLYDDQDMLRQSEFRPFNKDLTFGVTIYQLLYEDVFWVPCLPFDDNVIREMKYQLEHFPRGHPFTFSNPPTNLPKWHYRGHPDTNGCSLSMIQAVSNMSPDEIVQMDDFLTKSPDFQHFDFKIIPMNEQSLLVLRVTPINPKQKLSDIHQWFSRNFGVVAKFTFVRWSQDAGAKHLFEIVISSTQMKKVYSILLSLQTFNVRYIDEIYSTLSKFRSNETVLVSFENCFTIKGSQTIQIPQSHIFDIQIRERNIDARSSIPIRSMFGRNPQFSPSCIINPNQNMLTYEDGVGSQVRVIEIPYLSTVSAPSASQPSISTLDYDVQTRTMKLPNQMIANLPITAPFPEMVQYPLETVDLKEPPAPVPTPAAPPIQVNADGSITMDTFKVIEQIYTKKVYRFKTGTSLCKVFPPNFKTTSYCLKVKNNVLVVSFFIGINPFVLEITFNSTSMSTIPMTDPGILELRQDNMLYLNGTNISNDIYAYIVNDPQVTLCGMMIRADTPVFTWETPALNFKARDGKIKIKTFKRPRMILETFGTNAIHCRNVKFHPNLSALSMSLERDSKYYRSIMFDTRLTHFTGTECMLVFSNDVMYLNGKMHRYPNNFLYMCSTDPITQQEMSGYDHFNPRLIVSENADRTIEIIGDCVNIDKNIFMAYNQTSMIIYNDLMEELCLFEINSPRVLWYDFKDCDRQFVKIDRNRFTFDIRAEASEELTWASFFHMMYDLLVSNSERAEFIHNMNQFVENSTFKSKRNVKEFNSNYYFALIGSGLWIYERSSNDFYEIQQILNIDDWIHDQATSLDQKMLFIFNLFLTNFENQNFASDQNLMLANVRIPIRDLRL